MKRLLIPLVLIGSLVSLEGCVGDAIVSASSSSPAEANTVSAAGHLLKAAQPLADAYVKAPSTSPENRKKAADLSHKLRGYLDTALDAEAKGDSGAVAVALQSFNQYFPQFSALVGGPK